MGGQERLAAGSGGGFEARVDWVPWPDFTAYRRHDRRQHPYRNHTSQRKGQREDVRLATTMPITSGKTVASVTLPATLSQGSYGVFTIAAG